MIPKAYMSHQLESRVRLYLPFEKGNTLAFELIEEKLPECGEVERVQTNPLTGSVLIHHRRNLPEVIRFSQAHELFEVDQTLEHHQNWTQDLMEKLGEIDKRLIAATEGDLNLASLAALGLLGAGAFQLSRRHYLPAASTLITDAMRILLQVSRSVSQKNPSVQIPSPQHESSYSDRPI